MTTIDRLDFSKPPNGYLVWFDDGWSCVCWGLEDDGQAINTPDDNLTEEAAIAAAWDHCKDRHNPPGMWSGFRSILPNCVKHEPRMGVAIPGIAHLELNAGRARFGSIDEAMAAARAAAWAWYERRHAIASLLELRAMGGHPWPPPVRYQWPRPLVWTDTECDSVTAWLHDSTAIATPEALRG